MRTRVAASVALAVTIVLTASFMRGPVVIVSSDDGQLDACWRVSSGEVIVLVFTNSMYGGEVRESFRIDDDRLVRVAFETEHAASAEYYAWDRAVLPVAEGYRVALPEESFGTVPIRVDERGAYRLRFDDREVLLSDAIDGSSGAALRVESRSLIGRMACT